MAGRALGLSRRKAPLLIYGGPRYFMPDARLAQAVFLQAVLRNRFCVTRLRASPRFRYHELFFSERSCKTLLSTSQSLAPDTWVWSPRFASPSWGTRSFAWTTWKPRCRRYARA